MKYDQKPPVAKVGVIAEKEWREDFAVPLRAKLGERPFVINRSLITWLKQMADAWPHHGENPFAVIIQRLNDEEFFHWIDEYPRA